MTDDSIFSDEQMRAFRAVDRASVRTAASAPTTMTPEASRAWNSWCADMIERALMPLMETLGGEVGDVERRLKAEIKTIITDMAALRAENAELRGGLAYLRGGADARDRGGHEVLDLPALPRRGSLNG